MEKDKIEKYTPKTPFQILREMNFSNTHCFLCGRILDKPSGREHVFPKWLLSRFNLWDQKIFLLNRTTISYRYLTIPCCSICNNEHLSKLERIVEAAFRHGSASVSKLDKLHLYQWTGKIFFGLLFRELSLSLNLSSQASGTITSPEMIKQYGALHGFLQSIRTDLKFENYFPGSVFVFRIKTIPGIEEFDYSDNFIGLTFCLSAGNTGVITCLKDNEMIYEALSELYQKLKCVELHPIQFDEVCAIVFYRAFSMIRSDKHLSITAKGEPSKILKLPGLSLASYFEDWNMEVFARFLESFWSKWGISYKDILVSPNCIKTYLSEYL